MKIHRSHKIELKPNNVQATYFAKCAGTARFAWNWALAYSISEYQAGRPIGWMDLKKSFNVIKSLRFPWVSEVSKCPAEQAIRNLGTAFKNMWNNGKGYPNFKKKGVNDSFYVSNDQFKIDGKKVRIPKLGWVNLREELRFKGKILSATVSKKAGKWFISIAVELEVQEPKTNNSAVGIDLGITTFGALSDGSFIANPKPLKNLLKKLRRLNKELSRRVKGGKNWLKTKLKLQKLYVKIANIRSDFIHKFTSKLAEKYGYIMIEDLNVKGMAKTNLARSILDQAFGETRRQLEYKVQNVIAINRWFPSSKTCSECGTYYKDFGRNEDKMRCCSGLNRDFNASINILIEGLRTVGSTGLAYCLPSSISV